MGDVRVYMNCNECRRRVMLPRHVSDQYSDQWEITMHGSPWLCMRCEGETPRGRTEWAVQQHAPALVARRRRAAENLQAALDMNIDRYGGIEG